ncbi:MBL fold metallo-hydrolase, partial [Salidesulfovibrio brasiliensis]|uniref:MBL fold metallo-hydrolase n=1 Tax=Salidesulfovibrio brasiliensis TaxID=221711 RepID=UPI0006D07D56
FDIGRAVVGPYLASGRPPRLDAVVMTHADNDHMGGLAWIVERFAVNRFIGNGDAPDGVAGARIMKLLMRAESPGSICSPGMQSLLVAVRFCVSFIPEMSRDTTPTTAPWS